MKKKKAGFTLIEMIIVLMMTVLVIGIMSSIFSTGNRVFSEVNVKSDLQIEGQSVHEVLSKVTMQGEGIKEVKLKNVNVPIDFEKVEDTLSKENIMNKWNSIQEIVIYVAETDVSNKIVKNPYTFKLINNELLMIKPGMSSGRILSTNVEDFKINPSNVGIGFEINLKKKKGFVDKEYPIKVDVTFRNKGELE